MIGELHWDAMVTQTGSWGQQKSYNIVGKITRKSIILSFSLWSRTPWGNNQSLVCFISTIYISWGISIRLVRFLKTCYRVIYSFFFHTPLYGHSFPPRPSSCTFSSNNIIEQMELSWHWDKNLAITLAISSLVTVRTSMFVVFKPEGLPQWKGGPQQTVLFPIALTNIETSPHCKSDCRKEKRLGIPHSSSYFKVDLKFCLCLNVLHV